MQSVAAGVVFDVVRFPVWWYSQGLVQAVISARNACVGYERTLGVRVWAKNIFVPMFGRYDWQSRIISFFMRVANVFFRGVILCLFVAMVAVGLAAYIALPLVAAIFALYHAGDLIV